MSERSDSKEEYDPLWCIRKPPAVASVRIPLYPRGDAVIDKSGCGRWHLGIEGAGEPWVSRCRINDHHGGPAETIKWAVEQIPRPGESVLLGESCWVRPDGDWVMLAVSNGIRGWCRRKTLAIAVGCLGRA